MTTMMQVSSDDGALPNAAPTVVTQVDVRAACGRAGATRVELQATRIACIDPPPAPCTLPEEPRPLVGEGLDCPAAVAARALQIELAQTGRYHVEVVTLAGTEELGRVCVGEEGEVELLITEARINGRPTLEVAELDGSSCG